MGSIQLRTMRMRSAIPVLLFSATITCAAQGPENRYKLVDAGDMAEFVSELQSHNIPVRLEKDGFVYYPSDREEAVAEILKNVLAKRGGGVNYPDPIDMQSLRDKLARSGIPFREVTRQGRQWIIWDQSFDQRASVIQSEVDDESSERYRRARESKK